MTAPITDPAAWESSIFSILRYLLGSHVRFLGSRHSGPLILSYSSKEWRFLEPLKMLKVLRLVDKFRKAEMQQSRFAEIPRRSLIGARVIWHLFRGLLLGQLHSSKSDDCFLHSSANLQNGETYGSI